MAVLVDYKVSHLSEDVDWENGFISGHTFLGYTLCLIAAILLLVVGTLCIFLVLLNAAYKVFIFYDLSISMMAALAHRGEGRFQEWSTVFPHPGRLSW